MKKLLIVVDFQNDFVTGSLGFKQAEEIEQKITAKIKEYRENGADIAFTMDTHGSDYLTTQEGKNLPVEHCIKGQNGWELFGEVAKLKQSGDKVFEKPTFGSGELFGWLKESGYKTVELCGVVTNICVVSNAVLAKTALPEALVIVDAACVASNDESLGKKALEVMRSFQISVFDA